jgi:hypothetical protein
MRKLKIDTETYKLGAQNYCHTETKKTQIVLDVSNRKGHNHLTRLKNKDNKATKTWNTYTISRTGIIYEHYDPIYYSRYLGIDKFDKFNVSIVLENMGVLYERDNKLVNLLNEYDDCVIAEIKYFGFKYWENFSKKQLKATADLCKYLCTRLGINNECVDFNCFHADISKFNGIAFKSNYFNEDICTIHHLDIENFKNLLNK